MESPYRLISDDLTSSNIFDSIHRKVEIQANKTYDKIRDDTMIESFSFEVFQALKDDSHRNIQTVYRAAQPLHF